MRVGCRWVVALVVVASVLAGSGASPTGAAPPPDIGVRVAPVGHLADDGNGATVLVRTVCNLEGYDVFEAFLYVNQDGRSTEFAGLPIACDGRHRTARVTTTVPEGEPPLHRGPASVSAYVLVGDGTHESTVSPTFDIRLR